MALPRSRLWASILVAVSVGCCSVGWAANAAWPSPTIRAAADATRDFLATLEQIAARPVSMDAADFDRDGIQDLVVGYATNEGGLIALFRGNQDTIFPNTRDAAEREAAGTRIAAPFFAPLIVLETGAPPEIIAGSDFDGDGHRDVLFGTSANQATFLAAGNGKGQFAPSRMTAPTVPLTPKPDDGRPTHPALGVRGVTPIDILEMRLNHDVDQDLVVLEAGNPIPVTWLSGPAVIFTVNRLDATPDADPGDGLCLDTSVLQVNRCSLTAAISQAQANPVPTLIEFDLGSGTPTITGGPYHLQPGIHLTIDGATGGATRIETAAFKMTTSSLEVQIRSLVINGEQPGFNGGIDFDGLQDNVFVRIEDCYLGTDANGLGSVAGNQHGIYFEMWDSFGGTFIVGGPSAAQRNIISNNQLDGIHAIDASGLYIQGNYIGTDPSGSVAVPNGRDGIRYDGEAGIQVGGPTLTPGTPPGNVISGNLGNGATLWALFDAQARGNLIGTDASGTLSIGNSGTGISACTIASDNVISGNGGWGAEVCTLSQSLVGTDITGLLPIPNQAGGAGLAFDSVIAFNNGPGLYVGGANNSIFQNAGLGIDRFVDGVTPNDPGDLDNQPNFPEIVFADFDGSQTTIEGVLSSVPDKTFTVELFSNSLPDPSGFGEGETLIATLSPVATDSQGDAMFSTQVAGESRYVTAISDPNFSPGNRFSEFSKVYSNPSEPTLSAASRATGTLVAFETGPNCGAESHAVFLGTGPIAGGLDWTAAFCDVPTPTTTFDPGTPLSGEFFYWVVVAQNELSEGSYGRDSQGNERPEALGIGSCDLRRGRGVSCDP